jgi:hypothetical protein
MTPTIDLGPEDRVRQLYSYPNVPGDRASLAETVVHWMELTLARDGLAGQGATAAVRIGPDGHYLLDLDGPATLTDRLEGYVTRLPRFLGNGWNALARDVPAVKQAGRWDPSPDPPPPPYRPWRFFLPHGMAMLNQRSLQFFHYPPIRLLEGTRDYLQDPVPVRCYELLLANGVPEADLPLFNTVVDATPIAAEDDQGSKKAGDPRWGLIPIQYFHDYQRAQVALLLNPAQAHDDYTVPIVVYGAHPRATFEELYDVKLGVNVADTAEILPGRKTPVLGANHPYVFYAAAQGFATVGSGRFSSSEACAQATDVMIKDLVVTRWQALMAEHPDRSPEAVLADCARYWNDPARAGQVCALTRHQASLYYADPTSLEFTFSTSMDAAATFCAGHGNQPCAGVETPSGT